MKYDVLTICGEKDCEGCLNQHKEDTSYCEREKIRKKLKPCMCGGDAHIYTNQVGFFQAECDKCHIETPFYRTKEEVISAWNTRPIEDAKDEEIKRLRNVLENIRFDHPACFDDSDCPHNGGAGYDNGCLKCPYYLADETLKEKKDK